jgi:hypothetical protein
MFELTEKMGWNGLEIEKVILKKSDVENLGND